MIISNEKAALSSITLEAHTQYWEPKVVNT